MNRRAPGAEKAFVEVCTGGWEWKPVGQVPYRVEGNQMHVAVPRKMLGIQGDRFAVEFKWIDNTQRPGDILDLYINGDSAPGGRYRYRYDTRAPDTAKK